MFAGSRCRMNQCHSTIHNVFIMMAPLYNIVSYKLDCMIQLKYSALKVWYNYILNPQYNVPNLHYIN